MEASVQQKVIFDPENNYKIRVIEPEQFKETQKLKTGCDQFSTEVNEFMTNVKQFLEFMETQSRRVEDQKLRSIALRNRVQDEIESRKRAQDDLQNVIEAKQKQLERLSAEIRSWEEYERQLSENKDKLAMI
ncbi:hypothetical protein TVAG_233030 [Trichomonas vaginalis G3]|uniref:Intraflagellar transport particle protein n=1 Tax=Trichomonas vaginalis (strain ATCC PRA-98 / G3) TaxID=412133 RepID=A2ERX2_TRIV3|nr:Intraflagellar transport complex B, subunit 20 family [Trichomonas vaginalis G3]EAY04567.1 hypothetical protein TVAG_233030 [Trichomonas vaginalis G3]KAI5516066.1 Intraflagellar transport complex B, subunit 20 family [Trichomonas vaginalis G3]|eukprot:XP_001316790.1 hypothetical protein [Trichomonas vaginalis G3]